MQRVHCDVPHGLGQAAAGLALAVAVVEMIGSRPVHVVDVNVAGPMSGHQRKVCMVPCMGQVASGLAFCKALPATS